MVRSPCCFLGGGGGGGERQEIFRRALGPEEIAGAVGALNKKESLGVDQLVAVAYAQLMAMELDAAAARVTGVLHTGKAPKDLGGNSAAQ